MNLGDYPRPANGSKRWAHWSASCYPCHANYAWHLDQMVRCQFGGVKYVSDGNGKPGTGDSGLAFGRDAGAVGNHGGDCPYTARRMPSGRRCWRGL